MTFEETNQSFESWLRHQCEVVDDDLKQKHERMTKDAFVFLRATFFRWAGTIETVCNDLAGAPKVLSVGDAHLENFGTWRDAEGRLVWGINDFDEAAVTPYPFDLVRLAASARLAPDMKLDNGLVAGALLKGYGLGLSEARPTLLDEKETWMRPLVACTDEDRADFWKHAEKWPPTDPPAAARGALAAGLPPDAKVTTYATRVAGGGGLGRPRFVAVAGWRGGRIVREAKALVPSAWDWAHGNEQAKSRFMDLATGPSRAPDPWLKISDKFIVRRLAADSRKVELGDKPGSDLQLRLLQAMGFELGALHAGDPNAAAKIGGDLGGRTGNWLHDAAKIAAEAVKRDYDRWNQVFKK